jgi:hypothetical protein
MGRAGRIRWLSYPQTRLSPWRGRERSASIGAVLVMIFVIGWLGRGTWWGAAGPWALLVVQYVAWSLVATRDWGRTTQPRAPWAIVSLREWRQRLAVRAPLVLLGYPVLLTIWPFPAPTEEWKLLAVVPVPWVADYLWCCASRGAWLASLPPPPDPPPMTRSGAAAR